MLEKLKNISDIILDLYARKVIAWMLKAHIEQSLVLETLEKALLKRPFSGELIFHSDRGSQISGK